MAGRRRGRDTHAMKDNRDDLVMGFSWFRRRYVDPADDGEDDVRHQPIRTTADSVDAISNGA